MKRFALSPAARKRTAMTSSIPFEAEGVRGHLHRADGTGDGMVLTHGAGGDCNAPLLLAVAEAFQAASVTVLRCDLPFRLQRPSDRLDPQTRQGPSRPWSRGRR